MTLNEQAIAKMLEDNNFYAELKAFLEGLIDAELAKPDAEMNCNLIEECTDILLAAEGGDNNNAAILIPFVSSERLIQMAEKGKGFASLSKGARAAIIAASVAVLMLGSNAAIAETTGVNLLANMGTAVVEALESWGIIKSDAPQETKSINNSEEEKALNNPAPQEEAAEEAINPAEEAVPQPRQTGGSRGTEEGAALSEEKGAPVALRLSFADNFKTEYYWGESLDLSGLTVTAVYKDNETQSVPVKDCTVSGYNKALEGTQKILVEYEGAKASFDITLTKTTTREERFVTGVDGTPPTKQVYTTDDSSLQLYGLKVRLVYSDGTYSEYYTYNSAAIVKGADFTQTGEQKITLRIAGKADYTYTIIVNEAAVADDIKGIESLYSGYTFDVGSNLIYSDFEIRIIYQNGKSERLLYSEHADEIEIYNLDTTEETAAEKQFTVGYKGHYATVPYIVRLQRTLCYAKFMNGMPKFLYYKGEPLCYGKDINLTELENSLSELNSITQNPDFSGLDNVIYGNSDFKIHAYYLENASITYSIYYYSDLDFVGYDPYTEGYQVIDLYYEGMYLTSYLVFVYGDEGYCPFIRTEFEIHQGDEFKELGNNYGYTENGAWHYCSIWYNCAGDGRLERDSNNQVKAEILLENDNAYGRTTAIANLDNGETLSLNVNHLKVVKSVEAVFDNELVSIPLDKLNEYDFGDSHCVITLSNGETETVYLNDALKGYTRYISYSDASSTIIPISTSSDIQSALGVIRFALDCGEYSNVSLCYLPAFYYRQGYENTLQLICEHEYLEQGAYYDTSFTDRNFRKNTKFYISAYNNRYSLNYKDVTIEGVEWGTVGNYTATIKATYYGTELSCTQDIHIVDKVYDEKCTITYDPNKDRLFNPGEEFDAAGIKISFTNRIGNTVEIPEESIAYEITKNGSGHRLNNELYDETFTVRYTCTLPDGRTKAVSAYYKTDFCVNYSSVDYSWVPELNGVVVKFDPIDGADYYTIEFFGETYRLDAGNKYYITIDGKPYETVTPFVVCDRGLADGRYTSSAKNMVKITAYGTNENGEIIKGRTVGKSKTIVISGYVAPED